MARLIDLSHVGRALDLPDFNSARARLRMSPVPRGWQKRDGVPKQAAVMILLYPEEDERLHLVLTLRHTDLRGHSGQVSFPGGRQDPHDKNLTETAIRETCEEIGICADTISVIGKLPSFYIPASHYDVFPTVACCGARPQFVANPTEVARIFGFALESLSHSRYKCEERRLISGHDVHVPYYAMKGHKVWGATAIMLSELEERLRQVLPQEILMEMR